MKFTPDLTGDAAVLARQHAETLARLPATVHAFILTELQRWPALFAPEQRYQRALLEHLSQLPRRDLDQTSAPIARVETDAGLGKISQGNPSRFQDEAQALLRARGLFVAWRGAVDGFFQSIDPALEARLYPADAPRRLIVQIYGSGIAVEQAKLWSRFKGTGLRVPLTLDGAGASDRFLEALFGAREAGAGAPPLLAIRGVGAPGVNSAAPFDVWLIEAHEALHALCTTSTTSTASTTAADANLGVTGLSYDRLRGYRDELTRTLNRKIQSGVESPQAFASYARSLQIVPPAGALFDPAAVVVAFVRDVLLTGNGTLLMNNTFVEWAAIQALRRAQPRLLVTRFGVRDKLKPFSSMVMFAQPRASDHQPVVPDPAGSFIDVEQLSYYVWLNAEKNPAYRKKTLYLFLAEGVDEMLAIRSDVPIAKRADVTPARLADVHATMAHWLGVQIPSGSGQPIRELTS